MIILICYQFKEKVGEIASFRFSPAGNENDKFIMPNCGECFRIFKLKRRLLDFHNFYIKIKGFTGKRVIEVHYHNIFFNFMNPDIDALSVF